ncbi:MAG TPA: hypothetical protein VJB69_03340 [Candidatus Paceibacterota bacterium]
MTTCYRPLDRGIITITLTQKHDPVAFFQDRPGLEIDETMRRTISLADSCEAGTMLDVGIVDVKGSVNSEFENELLPRHLFTETHVCAVLAEMLVRQSKGEERDLLTDHSNLFYLPDIGITVVWRVDKWVILVNSRKRSVFHFNSRVFYP